MFAFTELPCFDLGLTVSVHCQLYTEPSTPSSSSDLKMRVEKARGVSYESFYVTKMCSTIIMRLKSTSGCVQWAWVNYSCSLSRIILLSYFPRTPIFPII